MPGRVVETVLRRDLAPARTLGKACCFCTTRVALVRVRTDVHASCPMGHIPPAQLDAIAAKAFSAALEDSDLEDDVTVELELPK